MTNPRPIVANGALLIKPAAFSSGIGNQLQKPLATVVMGWMLVGPVIMVVVVVVVLLLPALQTPPRSAMQRRFGPREAAMTGFRFNAQSPICGGPDPRFVPQKGGNNRHTTVLRTSSTTRAAQRLAARYTGGS
jgi:hypothetical protein